MRVVLEIECAVMSGQVLPSGHLAAHGTSRVTCDEKYLPAIQAMVLDGKTKGDVTTASTRRLDEAAAWRQSMIDATLARINGDRDVRAPRATEEDREFRHAYTGPQSIQAAWAQRYPGEPLHPLRRVEVIERLDDELTPEDRRLMKLAQALQSNGATPSAESAPAKG